MTATQVLAIAKEKGVVLEVRGGDIRCRAPKRFLTPELIELLRANKAAMIKLIGNGEVRCLGVPCSAVSYQDVDGHLCLWCGHLNRGVINLMECPFEAWGKDNTGFPLPDRRVQ